MFNYINGNKSDWEQLLSAFGMVNNLSRNSSPGYTPAFLDYGFHPVAPVQLLPAAELCTVEDIGILCNV